MRAGFDGAMKGVVEGMRLLPAGVKDACVEPYWLQFAPQAKVPGHFFQHKGEEMGYVLSGTLVFWVGGQRQEAGAGDLIYLKIHIPERWENPGETAVELLWFKCR